MAFWWRKTCENCTEWSDERLCTHCNEQLKKAVLPETVRSFAQYKTLHYLPGDSLHFLYWFHRRHPALHLLYRFKYHKAAWVGDFFGSELGVILPDYSPETYLLPVPLHPQRERQRGYNQSLKIAEQIANIRQLPLANNWVQRSAHFTHAQATKDRYQRLRDSHQLFHVQAIPTTARAVILLDDVITTGYTVTALACALWDKRPDLQIHLASAFFHSHLLK